MTREELEARVKAALIHEYASREDMKDREYRHVTMLANMYGNLGAPMFVYDLLDTPGVLEVVSEYIESNRVCAWCKTVECSRACKTGR